MKKLEHLTEIDEFLTSELGHLDFVNDPDTSPWVINHAHAGKNSADVIRE